MAASKPRLTKKHSQRRTSLRSAPVRSLQKRMVEAVLKPTEPTWLIQRERQASHRPQSRRRPCRVSRQIQRRRRAWTRRPFAPARRRQRWSPSQTKRAPLRADLPWDAWDQWRPDPSRPVLRLSFDRLGPAFFAPAEATRALPEAHDRHDPAGQLRVGWAADPPTAERRFLVGSWQIAAPSRPAQLQAASIGLSRWQTHRIGAAMHWTRSFRVPQELRPTDRAS